MSEAIVDTLTTRELEIFNEVCELTPFLIGLDNSSCLSVCLEFESVIDELIRFIGTFGNVHEHAWLEFKENDTLILDPYPVACLGGPLLVDKGSSLLIPTPWNNLYKKIW